ncbi:BatD family protein [Alkalimarinus coralli]|uniref:BatD family protein n=1 Tax=Alkalimarinus coralli TaxID=2935863 RepID=UPI00202B1A42|nr:BatD family protein [Alkalimarinus coralli]
MVSYFLANTFSSAAGRFSRAGVAVLLTLVCLGISTPLFAADSDELHASVDRTQIHQNETVELTIIGQLELELNFSNLFNLRNMELPAPDLGTLENDFEIIDQQQKYNIQSINGTHNATITWVYTLSPKSAGALTIPSIKHADKASQPIGIKVLKGKASPDDGRPPLVFMEAEVDKQEAYVQEQIIYTLRLYYADNLVSGDLSNPELDDAIIEQVGDQKKYYRMRYNQRYEVIERKFLIFPQKSGELAIAPQTFSGTIIDSRLRKRKHIRDSSDAINVNVRPPASEFTGQVWLPAISLNLTEKWDKPLENVSVGDSFTRTISIQTLGLLGSALPPLNISDNHGFKQYPDQPETESLEHQAGVESSRTESIAMVAVKAGKVTLPEIKIPWWDTVNQVERVAVIPARELTIASGNGAPPVSEEQSYSEPAETSPVAPEASPSESGSNNAATADKAVDESGNGALYVIIALLISGWAITTVILLKRKNTVRVEQEVSSPIMANSSSEEAAFEKLSGSIRQKSPDMLGDLVQWAKIKWPEATINSVADVERLLDDETLSALISKAESAFYSPATPDTPSSNWDNDALLKCLNEIRKKDRGPSEQVLPNFYP